ncbi:MAG: hypothetical protein ABI407_10490, partial [Bradyrhizobium sp.]
FTVARAKGSDEKEGLFSKMRLDLAEPVPVDALKGALAKVQTENANDERGNLFWRSLGIVSAEQKPIQGERTAGIHNGRHKQQHPLLF